MCADEGVVWWCITEKFSGCSGGFNPGFDETEEVRVVSIDQVRESNRVEGMKNGADIKSTDSEKFAGPAISSVSPERRKRREADYRSRECAGERTAGRQQTGYGCGRSIVDKA